MVIEVALQITEARQERDATQRAVHTADMNGPTEGLPFLSVLLIQICLLTFTHYHIVTHCLLSVFTLNETADYFHD